MARPKEAWPLRNAAGQICGYVQTVGDEIELVWNGSERISLLWSRRIADGVARQIAACLSSTTPDGKPQEQARKAAGNEIPWPARKAVHARSRGLCEVGVPGVCKGIGEHVHHVLRRVNRQHDPEVLLHACRPCHDWIHAHVAESYERGWLVRSKAVAS